MDGRMDDVGWMLSTLVVFEAQDDHETVTTNCSLRLILARDILRRRKKQREGRQGGRRKVHYVTIWRRMCSCTRNHNFCLFCLSEGNYPRAAAAAFALQSHCRRCCGQSGTCAPLTSMTDARCPPRDDSISWVLLPSLPPRLPPGQSDGRDETTPMAQVGF